MRHHCERRLPIAGAVEHRLDRQRELDRRVVDGVLDAFLDQVQLQREAATELRGIGPRPPRAPGQPRAERIRRFRGGPDPVHQSEARKRIEAIRT